VLRDYSTRCSSPAHDGVLRTFDFQAEGAELLAEGKISRDSGYTFQRWRFQEARR